MDFEIDMSVNYEDSINLEEVFQRYPIIEEKSVLIMSLYEAETMIDNKVINQLKVRLTEMNCGGVLEVKKENLINVVKGVLMQKLTFTAIKQVLKRGDISFNAALEKLEFSEKDVGDTVQRLYDSISERIDLLSKLTPPPQSFTIS